MTTVFFDFETGGVNDEPNIQLAAIAVDGQWREVATYEAKIQFDASLAQPEALKINHYDPEVWTRESKHERTVVVEFAQFLRPFCCVNKISKAGKPYNVARMAGHNAATFDMPRLRRMFGTSFLPCEMHVRDTLQLALWHFSKLGKEPENYRLSTLCEYFGVPSEEAHDAFTDCRLSAAIARIMTETVLERTIRLRGENGKPTDSQDTASAS